MSFHAVNIIPVLCCAASAVWLNHNKGDYASLANPSSQIVVLFSSFTVIGMLWSWALYPYLFHPLRSLPLGRLNWRYRLYRWIYAEPNPAELFAMANATPNKGSIRFTGTWGEERLLITDGIMAKQILSTEAYSAFPQPLLNRQRLERLVGRGLIWAEGETHKIQRRKLHHAFTHSMISELYPHFWEKACEMTSLIEVEGKKSAWGSSNENSKNVLRNVDLGDWTTRAALDLIGYAAWGTDFNTLKDPKSDFSTIYERQFVPAPDKLPFIELGLVLPLWLTKLMFQKQTAVVMASTILTRKASIAAVQNEKLALQKKDPDRHNILSIAIQSGAFSDEDLIGQMQNILVAGHETTASTIFFLFHILALHPEKQERLRQEIRSAIPRLSPQEPPSATTLQHLPYLQACINETLRVWPVLSIITRQASKDVMIGGHMIPEGMVCAISPHVFHRSEEVWGSDAGKFNPDRWLETSDNSNNKNKNDNSGAGRGVFVSKLLTFSVGPKQCIGQDFARGELLALTAAVVGRFKLELERPEEEVDLFWGIIMKAKKACEWRLERVDDW